MHVCVAVLPSNALLRVLVVDTRWEFYSNDSSVVVCAFSSVEHGLIVALCSVVLKKERISRKRISGG